MADADVGNIVVTGSRVRRAAPAAAAFENSCTLDDPTHSLAACGRQVDPGRSGTAGRADARIADGLTRAWQGDLDGARAAFDQAIALDPHRPLAWLNRGLARQRSGDMDGALADLDRAVRLAPDDARTYHARAQLLRQRGDARRATTDERRAAELDAER
jgi:Tfp pilus assembly protein PilF